MWHIIVDAFRNAVLITGLVVVMMMMIESLNIESKGMVFKGLKKTRFGQVVIAALLGSIPGCMGGFATVSLYTHRMFSFGALVAMMIASSGDEAFVMLAMIPEQAMLLFAILFTLAIVVGVTVDLFHGKAHSVETDCHDGYVVHESEEVPKRHFGWKRILMFVGLALFIAALATGHLGHEHGGHEGHVHEHHHHIDLLSEEWMNMLFAGLSVIVLFVLIFASDHFVEGHLWNHIIKRHLPTIFAWTFGVLLILGIGMQYVELDKWISSNTALMILLATLIGIIPESGPHMIFVTLFAAGVVPFPVLLASSISQDGHASIPLLAESRKSFAWAKLINCLVALAAGYAAMLLF